MIAKQSQQAVGWALSSWLEGSAGSAALHAWGQV